MNTFLELKQKAKCQPIDLQNSIKIGIVGDSATQFLALGLKGCLAFNSISVDMFEADYNEIELQLFNPNSALHKFEPSVVIFFNSVESLKLEFQQIDLLHKKAFAKNKLDFIKSILENNPSYKFIYYNYPLRFDSVYGNYALKNESSFAYQIYKLNMLLNEFATKCGNLFICDLQAIENEIGHNSFFESSIYVNTEMVLSMDSIPIISERTVDIIKAIKGRIKKCLILDLDNTLWGGIIGDDGISGIQIGHGIGIGKVYSEIQLWAKSLKERGIILTVCSKNNEEIAKEVFEKHPEMVLKLDDFAIFLANWNSKVDNIKIIQQNLNIGFDSMVFLDDSKFERNSVRYELPDICVPELPEDPAEWIDFLTSLNLFETATYSEADSDRTKQYQIEFSRKESAKNFNTESDYLESLNMVSKVENFNDFNIPRVAQLSQRSNQFNLRTIRYTEDELKKIASDNNNYMTLAFSLKDKFGDNGLISALIGEKIDGETLFISTFFMSCRVLNRGMEEFIFNTLISSAKENKIKFIKAEYIPTKKNAMVADLYSKYGFEKKENLFYIDVDNYTNKVCYIKGE